MPAPAGDREPSRSARVAGLGLPSDIRVAVPADRDAAVSTIVAAFSSDPEWGWVLGDRYEELAPLWAGALFDWRVNAGTIWVSADVSSLAICSDAGGQDDASAWEDDLLWGELRQSVGRDVSRRMGELDAALSEHEVGPYLYLSVLATHPDRQGVGLASGLIDLVLARAEETGLDCSLETASDENRSFYERRGFVERPIALRGGPQMWWMTRPAARPPETAP